jgi:hypothetical protein
MGAFFLAEFCQNATITGNLVDGTNGSRVISVEKSCTDVTMIGNTFRNGGRGAWINQPVNFIMTGNVFVNNTTKNEPDKRRGRIAYQTAEPGKFPELYFTLYEPGASYGPVIVKDNIFIVGDSAPEEAVTFAPNGHDLTFTGNTFQNKPVTIVVPFAAGGPTDKVARDLAEVLRKGLNNQTVVIENVGNLVCPAEFDVGEHAKAMVYSVTEGEDKPQKYPVMFRSVDVVLLNKIDLVPHLDADVDTYIARVREVNPSAAILPVSARTGEGMGAWLDWVRAFASAR